MTFHPSRHNSAHGWAAVLLVLLLTPASIHCFLDEPTSLSPLQYHDNTTANGGAMFFDLDSATGLTSTSMNVPQVIEGGLPEVVKRQTRRCPAGYIPCGDGVWCHLPGTFCCPNDRSKSCPTGNTCCGSSGCARSGYSCCPNGQLFSCPTGTSCCPAGSRGCAPPGGSCCGDTVCFANEKCCGGTHCAPKTAACCGDGYCSDPGATCCNGVACAKAGYQCCPGGERFSCPTGSTCCKDSDGPYCGRNGCLPTLRFPNIRGITDEVADNICKGLKAYFQKNGHVEFTWNGPGRANRRITRRNRRASGCGGGLRCPSGYNCDEFPLASTAEGGKGATIGCVPNWLNGFYGYWWNIWRIAQLRSGFTKGSKFRITIAGCDFTGLKKRSDNPLLPKLEERQDTSNNIVLSSHGDVTVFDGSFIGNGTEGNNVVFVPLRQDDGNPGSYTLQYTLKEGESITSGWIMDEEGEIYETLDELKPGDSNTTTFQIEDADDSPVYFFGWTKATDVQMDVSVEAPPAATSSSPSSASEPTSTTNTDRGPTVPTATGPSGNTNTARGLRVPEWTAFLVWLAFMAIAIW